jgi:hypothetical protein
MHMRVAAACSRWCGCSLGSGGRRKGHRGPLSRVRSGVRSNSSKGNRAKGAGRRWMDGDAAGWLDGGPPCPTPKPACSSRLHVHAAGLVHTPRQPRSPPHPQRRCASPCAGASAACARLRPMPRPHCASRPAAAPQSSCGRGPGCRGSHRKILNRPTVHGVGKMPGTGVGGGAGGAGGAGLAVTGRLVGHGRVDDRPTIIAVNSRHGERRGRSDQQQRHQCSGTSACGSPNGWRVAGGGRQQQLHAFVGAWGSRERQTGLRDDPLESMAPAGDLVPSLVSSGRGLAYSPRPSSREFIIARD